MARGDFTGKRLGSSLGLTTASPKSVLDEELFYSRFVDAGTLAAGTFKIFNNSVGQEEALCVANTRYPLLDCDTNLVGQGGQLPEGFFFTCRYIEIRISMTNHNWTTPFAGNNATTLNPLPDAAAEFVADNQMQCVLENTTFTLFKNMQIPVISGLLSRFPQLSGIVGHTGTADGMSQNSIMARKSITPFTIESLQTYYGEWKICRPMTITAPFKIYFVLGGTLFSPVGR